MSAALTAPHGALAAGEAPSSDDARIVHALNRLGYGARPGEVEKVRSMGLEKWIEAQLKPEAIPDPDIAKRLEPLRTLAASSGELIERYDIPPEIKRELQKKRAEIGENASEEEMRRARREFMKEHADALGKMEGKPQDVIQELQAAKLLRAIYGGRQLDEVLVDFWMNHFNVFANKGQVKFLITEYERDVIRPRAWGKFEDLLLATAQSPAMLFYLDNWLSADPNAAPERPQGRRSWRRGRPPGMEGDEEQMMRKRPEGAPPQQGKGRRRGLNENYAREIMELHTLGVDGGYTQKDVTEVARCFTGWTIRGMRENEPGYTFEPRLHDKGDKVVLGQTVTGSGEDEGRRIIHMLATHPSTARFIAKKLSRRFVSDDPPASLVERAAETFRKTDGDIRAVVRTIVTSREFFAPEARAAKVKTPLDFVVSAVRAARAEVTDPRDMARRLGEMGMPLYLQQPPTGYKDTADAWVSTSGLLARLNFSLDLAAGRVRGVSVDVARLAAGAGDAEMLADELAAKLLPSGLSDATRKTLDREAGAGLDAARVAGLILGSPEFQRR